MYGSFCTFLFLKYLQDICDGHHRCHPLASSRKTQHEMSTPMRCQTSIRPFHLENIWHSSDSIRLWTMMWTLNSVIYYYANWFLCTVYAFWWCIMHCSNNVGVKTKLIEWLCITRPVGKARGTSHAVKNNGLYAKVNKSVQHGAAFVNSLSTLSYTARSKLKWSFYDLYKSKMFYRSSQYKCVLRRWRNSFLRGREWMSLALWNILKF